MTRLRVVPAPTTSLRVCRHWIGSEERYCLATERVRLYPEGDRCPAHTPSALAGKPEPDPPLRSRPALSLVPTSKEN